MTLRQAPAVRAFFGLLATVLVFASSALPAWADDEAAPVLNAISVSGSAFSPGDAITVPFELADNSGSIAEISVVWRGPLNGVRSEGLSKPALNDHLTFAVPDNWPNGAYTLDEVIVSDPSDNQSTYHRDGTVTKYPSGASGPTEHSLDFSRGDFTVAGSSADTVVPVLNSLGISSHSASPGDSLSLSYDASDDSGALSQVEAELVGSSGRRYLEMATANPAEVGSIDFTVPDDWPNGSYTIYYVSLEDPSGNQAVYFSNGTVSKTPSGAVGPTQHSLDFSQADFTVSGSTADITDPVLNAFSVSAPTFAPGDQITFGYDVSDDSGELGYMWAHYTGPLGGDVLVQIANDPSPLKGSRTITVPSSWHNGTYTLNTIELTDPAGNCVYYYRDGSVVKSSSGSVGPTSHSLDLSTADFSVGDGTQGSGGTTTSPTPTASPSPTPQTTSPTAPDAPTAVQAAVSGSQAASVSWAAAADNGSPVTQYYVMSSPAGSTCTTSGELGCTVTGLVPGTKYTFSVIATNDVGSSAASEPSNTVVPAALPTGVRHLHVVVRGHRAIVRWRAPLDSGTGPLVCYRVRVGERTFRVGPDVHHQTFRRLAIGDHTVVVKAKNEWGWGRGRRSAFSVT